MSKPAEKLVLEAAQQCCAFLRYVTFDVLLCIFVEIYDEDNKWLNMRVP